MLNSPNKSKPLLQEEEEEEEEEEEQQQQGNVTENIYNCTPAYAHARTFLTIVLHKDEILVAVLCRKQVYTIVLQDHQRFSRGDPCSADATACTCVYTHGRASGDASERASEWARTDRRR